MANIKHNQTTMGGYRSPTYKTWSSMLFRCYGNDPSKQKGYRDKGVIVCDRWHDFNNFLSDMGERPNGKTIDRFPNKEGNYEPSNCRWATAKEQQRNLSNNVTASYNGEKKTLVEWCELLGLSYSMMWQRLKEGIPVDVAFTEPKRSAKILQLCKNKKTA